MLKRLLLVALVLLSSWYWGFPALLSYHEKNLKEAASVTETAAREHFKKTRCGESILFKSMIENNEVTNCYKTKSI